jgi:hypothetical protein
MTITDDGIKGMTNMQKLDLSNNNIITDDGIKGMIKMEKLNLHNN